MTRTHRIAIVAVCCSAALLLAQTPPNQQNGNVGGAQAGPPQAAGRGGRGGRGGGGGRGGFPQHTRQVASQDVLARGKALYETNCASCHATDLRGKDAFPRLLRSGVALSDQHGELIGAAVAKHTPKLNIVEVDNAAISEYIHSVLATTGGQGSPPGRNPVGLQLNVLVGDAKAGQSYFDTACAACHSPSGDLKGIASKYSDPRSLQNAWVAGTSAANPFGGARGGGGGVGNPVTVTMPDGQALSARAATLKSIKIGQLDATTVPCLIVLDNYDGPPVLGASFLDRFHYQLDTDAGTLTLTRVDVAPAKIRK